MALFWIVPIQNSAEHPFVTRIPMDTWELGQRNLMSPVSEGLWDGGPGAAESSLLPSTCSSLLLC